MEEIIAMMIQTFKENQNKPMTAEHLIDYYLKNKQLPFGKPATEKQLKEAIKVIYRNGTVSQSVSNTGTYSKVLSYTYVVETPNQQLNFS
jgi:hypothetical protein